MPKRIGSPKRSRHFIAEWRKYRGISQDNLAERIGTSKASISRIENGIQPYTQDFLEVAAEALMTDPASLVMRNPEETEALWTLWEKAKPAERAQIVEMAKIILRTGT